MSGYCIDGDHGSCLVTRPSECGCDCHDWQDWEYEHEAVTKPPEDGAP